MILIVQGAREAHDVLELYQKATTSGIPVPDWVSHLPFGSGAVQTWWRDNLSGGVPAAGDLIKRVNRGSVLEIGRDVGTQVSRRLVIFFFALMTLFFLLKDGKALVRDLLKASQKLFGSRGERVARQMVASVHGTVDGLVLVGLGEGVLMGIAYAVRGAVTASDRCLGRPHGHCRHGAVRRHLRVHRRRLDPAGAGVGRAGPS